MKDFSLLEVTKLLVAAATPLTIFVLGVWIKRHEQINGELIKKKIWIYDQIVGPANDLLCFYTGVGHWRSFDPDVILQKKRDLDRVMYCYRAFWSEDCWSLYEDFMQTYFRVFRGSGKPAALRLNLPRLKQQLGPAWQDAWDAAAWTQESPPAFEDFRRAYDTWMRRLAVEIGTSASFPRPFHLE